MGKWFLLLLVLAALVGFYWTVGSGTFADRNIHMHLQRAASAGTPETIQSHLESVQEQVRAQRQWIERLRFVARNPDTSGIDGAEAFVEEVNSMLASAGAGPAFGSEGGDQSDQILQRLRGAHIHAGFFRPGEQKVWGIVFWILAIGAGLTGLVSFVRTSA